MTKLDSNSDKDERSIAELILSINNIPIPGEIPTMDEIVAECRIVRALFYEKKLKDLNQPEL